MALPWRFASTELKVAVAPPWARSGGYRKRVFEPPGYDGISAVLDDGRFPVGVSATVLAATYDEYEALAALFESGINGNLEIAHAGDAWVYANAFVDGRVIWEPVSQEDAAGDPALYKARVNFTCPNPRPTWKSTGELVF